MSKLISVIIPVYNVEPYIERCVKSVVYQSYTNLEIILVNDGSTDSSGAKCDKLSKYYNRIKVIHKENGGLSDARNVGLDICQGEYIAFLDSDDYIHKNMYEIMMEQMEVYQADLVECGYNNTWGHSVDRPLDSAPVICMDRKEALLSNYEWQYFRSVVWNKLYKREFVKELRFPKGKIHEDEFFTYKVLHQAEKLIHIAYPMVYYQQRENSIIGSGMSIRSLDVVEAYKERLLFFREMEPDIYKKGCEQLVDFLFKRLDFLLMMDKRPMRVKRKVMDAFAEELKTLDGEILSHYIFSNSKKYSFRLLKWSKTLYMHVYRWYWTLS